MSRLTDNQKRVLYALDIFQGGTTAKANERRALDRHALARTVQWGLTRTMSALVARGLVVSFVGGVGRPREHWQLADGVALCPHGCGPLYWCEDQWFCARCGDEWGDEVMRP